MSNEVPVCFWTPDDQLTPKTPTPLLNKRAWNRRISPAGVKSPTESLVESPADIGNKKDQDQQHHRLELESGDGGDSIQVTTSRPFQIRSRKNSKDGSGNQTVDPPQEVVSSPQSGNRRRVVSVATEESWSKEESVPRGSDMALLSSSIEKSIELEGQSCTFSTFSAPLDSSSSIDTRGVELSVLVKAGPSMVGCESSELTAASTDAVAIAKSLNAISLGLPYDKSRHPVRLTTVQVSSSVTPKHGHRTLTGLSGHGVSVLTSESCLSPDVQDKELQAFLRNYNYKVDGDSEGIGKPHWLETREADIARAAAVTRIGIDPIEPAKPRRPPNPRSRDRQILRQRDAGGVGKAKRVVWVDPSMNTKALALKVRESTSPKGGQISTARLPRSIVSKDRVDTAVLLACMTPEPGRIDAALAQLQATGTDSADTAMYQHYQRSTR
eukprot:TRINITY_DN79480_c0_g1_i1.p1 TRINITY_DN79480_c0_g1~~TRINITY_DN79480_c0_g1_i1.p1  ORF type:complete len:449 (+),score=53.81 TRINITY_DN79480_c0_g1_i1:30-1349(+)